MQEGLEEIQLDDFNAPKHAPPPPPAGEGEDWLSIYKTKMGTAIEIMQRHLLNKRWELVEPIHPYIALYELPDFTSEFYTLKAFGIVKGRASRYLHVIKDHEDYTRMPWDKENVAHVQQMETYKAEEGDIHVVQSTWLSKHSKLLANRHVLGIMHTQFDDELQTYSLHFCTAPHYFYKRGDDSVSANVMLCVILRKLDKETTEITLCIRIDPQLSRFMPTMTFIQTYKEELRKRILLYEFVVNRWDEFYGPKNDPKKK